jgi:hypothetical protein
MNKAQLLILLLIIALVCYYLNEENQSPKNDNLIVKKSVKPQLPKPPATFPQPPVNNQPHEPNSSFVYFPGCKYEPAAKEIEPKPTNFGLNPPHSQLNEPPSETIQPLEPSIELFGKDDSLLNETYRPKFLTLLTNFPTNLLTQQALDALQVKDQPLPHYFSAI